MDQLSKDQIKKLKSLAHGLKPVVYVGQRGISESLVASCQRALADHELIKAKFIDHKDKKQELTEELAAKCEAHIVNIIGNMAILYRVNPERDDENKIRV